MIHSHDPLEVTQLKIKDEKKYIANLCEKIEKDLRDREPLEAKWKIAIAQYNSALQSEDRQGGESEDSELDVPSTRKFIEMAISRFLNPITQRDKIYLAKPTKPNYFDVALAFEEFADWMVKRAPFRLFLEQFLKQAFIFTKGVAKVPFRRHTKKIKQYYHEIEDYETGEITQHDGLRNENDPVLMKSMFTEESADANPEVISCQDFIHPMPIKSINSAPRVTHRVWKTLAELTSDIKRGVYRDKTPEGKSILAELGDPSSKPDADLELSLHSGKKEDSDKEENDGELYEIFEVYTTRDEEEVIITFERKSKVCLRAIENFYMEEERPFAVWSYEAILNDIDGSSLCYILEPYHRALSAILNQRLDAASRAMSQIGLFNQSLGLDKYVKNGKLSAGWYSCNAPGKLSDQVEQFKMSESFSQIESLEASIKGDMQGLAALTDYNAGVEQIQRPTATGQVALLEEGKQPQYMRMESFREFLIAVGTMMIARYRQFYPVCLKYYVELKEPEEQQLVETVITWPKEYWQEQLVIEPAVTSQTMNKDLQKQEYLAIVDKWPQIAEQIMTMVQAAMSPDPTAPVAAKLLDYQIEFILKPFMKTFEIYGDDVLDFGEEMQIGQQFNQAIEQAQSQIQSLEAGLEEKDGQIAEVIRVLNHQLRQFVAATGRVPQPPPAGKSKETGPIAPAQGMGGGAPVPGNGGPPPMGGAPPGQGN